VGVTLQRSFHRVERHLILKTQANAVLRELEAAGLEPSDFRWNEVDSEHTHDLRVSQLEHPRSGFFFRFDFQNHNHFALFSPGDGKAKQFEFPGSWELQYEYLKKWLSLLKTELDEPDLWAAITQERRLVVSGAAPIENSPFSPEEQTHIDAVVNELRVYLLTTVAVESPEAKYIEARLRHLEEASSRLGRKDWINLALGILVNIAVGVALAPDAARSLLRLAGQLLGWVTPDTPMLP
jgi:hypothetical protein